MKVRKSRSKIFKIKDASGVWLDEAPQIQQLFVHDFTSRFKSSHTNSTHIEIELPKMVSEEDNDLLLRPIQDQEVKDAIFQMKQYKTPGPDGFEAALFQDYWHIIEKDVCQAIKSFFHEGKLLK